MKKTAFIRKRLVPAENYFYSDFLISMNRPSQAMVELERALELDPFNAFYQCFKSDSRHRIAGRRAPRYL